MDHITGRVSFKGLVDLLAEQAVVGAGAPRSLADRARSATMSNLIHLDSEVMLDPVSAERVRNYFAAALRRISARTNSPDARVYRRRAIAASLAADLRQTGMDESRVIAEVAASIGAEAGELLRAC